MHDPKQEPHEFVADNREAALEKARSFFGLEDAELIVQEFAAGEVYGLGGRSAVVAVPKNRSAPVRSERDSGSRRSEGRERGGRDRDRGDRGDRDRGRGRGGRERGGRERGGREDRGRSREPRAAAPELSDEPSVGTAQGDLGEIGKFVLGTIERLDIGPFEISESSEDEVTAIEVRGAAALVLAAGEARAIDALQLLANQVLARAELPGRVVLDVEGGEDSREKHLESLAERVVRRAVDGGRAIALDPMNGRDRRTVHIAVREHEGVATMSIGEGRYRQVVVVPEGAPEYEEALRQSGGDSD